MSLILQIVTLGIVLLLGAATIVVLIAIGRLRPPRLTDAKAIYILKRLTPLDLGMDFLTCHFTVTHPVTRKPLRLAAWLVQHPQAHGRTVVLIHGYADAKIGAAAWLPLLYRQQVNILLLDLPGHGDSDPSLCTAGFHERHLVSQLLDQFKTQHPESAQQIFLFGISMGSAVALATAHLRRDIAAVIIDSPYSDIRRAHLRHASLFGMPGHPFQAPATWLTEFLLKIHFAEVAPINLIPLCPCPILLIQAGNDYLISPADAQHMRQLIASRPDPQSRSLIIPSAAHILGLAVNPFAYEQAVSGFITQF